MGRIRLARVRVRSRVLSSEELAIRRGYLTATSPKRASLQQRNAHFDSVPSSSNGINSNNGSMGTSTESIPVQTSSVAGASAGMALWGIEQELPTSESLCAQNSQPSTEDQGPLGTWIRARGSVDAGVLCEELLKASNDVQLEAITENRLGAQFAEIDISKIVKRFERARNSLALASANAACTEDLKAALNDSRELFGHLVGCVAALDYKLRAQQKYMSGGAAVKIPDDAYEFQPTRVPNDTRLELFGKEYSFEAMLLQYHEKGGKVHGAKKSEFLRPFLSHLFAQVLSTDEAAQYTVSHTTPKGKYPKLPTSFIGAIISYINAGFGIPVGVRTELSAEDAAFARSVVHLTYKYGQQYCSACRSAKRGAANGQNGE